MNNKIKIQLTDREFNKLAEDVGVSAYDLQKLYAIGLLHAPSVLDFLIHRDFKKIKRRDKYQTSQVVARLAMYYNVSRDKVLNAVHLKRVASWYCSECGKLIRKREYNKNNGKCNDCAIRSIEIPE